MRAATAFLCSSFLWSVLAQASAFGQTTIASSRPLKNAHAHNDYLHDRPLLDALQSGFCSVEADIFLKEGKLLVAHTLADIVQSRTLENLYLNPLRKRIQEYGGKVYSDGSPLLLLIDIKSKGDDTYTILDSVLANYGDILTHVDNERLVKRPVSVVVSGNRPISMMAADRSRYAAIDGRLTDLGSSMDPSLMPLISDNWNVHFRWRGAGQISDDELSKLRSIVRQVRDSRRMLRFWGTPDVPAMWTLLHHEKVGLINTDDLKGLNQFLLNAP